MQRPEKVLEQKSISKSALIAWLFHFLPGHPKPAFSEKVQRGDQGKFFKNGPKSVPLLKGLKELAQMALSFNWNALKVKKLEKILGKKAAPKVPEWPSDCNFCNVTQNLHFLKKCKWGTKGNFSKLAQKVCLV